MGLKLTTWDQESHALLSQPDTPWTGFSKTGLAFVTLEKMDMVRGLGSRHISSMSVSVSPPMTRAQGRPQNLTCGCDLGRA